MRLFIGIPLAEETTNELLAISLRYRSPDDGLRWSTPESWHITLQFLGNTSEEHHSCLVQHIHGIQHGPVTIHMESLGFFDRAGIFFAGIQTTPELVSLQQQVISATASCGFAAETRAYHPHITLARTKGRNPGDGLRKLKNIVRCQQQFSSFTSRELLLYESHLGSSGSRYEVRERFLLTTTLHGKV